MVPLGRIHAHRGTNETGSIRLGDVVRLTIDAERRAQIRANHSATHLLHAALRHRLGGHVTQKGSLVDAARLRFDFSQPKPLSPEELAAVEAEGNARTRPNDGVGTRDVTPQEEKNGTK